MNKNRLYNILEMSNLKLIKYLNSAIRRKHYDVYTDDDNYIFAVPKNTSNHIMLVSHMDTVKRNHKVVLIEDNGVVSNANGVLGADDRAGVFAVLEISDKLVRTGQPLPYLLFTNYEESGGIGAKQFCMDKIAMNVESDIYFMIELDRKGVNDAVYYDEPEDAVKTLIESVGYVESYGTFSDVSTLSNHNGIGHVNLSIGYFHEHTKNEILVLSVVDFAINNVLNLMPLIDRRYDIDYTSNKWGNGKWGAIDDFYGDGYTYNKKGFYGKSASSKGVVTIPKDTKPFIYDAQKKSLPAGNPSHDTATASKESVTAYTPEMLMCPVCMEYGDEIQRFPILKYNKCHSCGTYFDDTYKVIEFAQSDEEALEMLEELDEFMYE